MNTATDPIAQAAARGATFEQRDAEHIAILHGRRARKLPLAEFRAPSKAEAAELFLNYIGRKS